MTVDFSALGPAQEFYNIIDRNAGLGVLFAGRERNQARHRVQTVRDHYLFHYILEGKGSFSLGKRTWLLGPGAGFLLAPGIACRYVSDSQEPWVYAWVGFHGREVARILTQVGLKHPVFEAAFDPVLAQRILGLTQILEQRPPGFSLAAEGQLMLLLSDVARLNGERARVDLAAKAESHTWAEAAAEFLQTNFHRNIGTDDVAAYVGFHPSHLGRLFRAHYGTSVHAWLIRTRIERAKLLLRSTDRSVTEVAQSVGFRSYSPFEKRFRSLTGTSPTNYRRGSFFT